MSTQPEQQFRDPALKQAVCRCWAKECASAMLKQRVALLIEETQLQVTGGSDSTAPMRINRFSRFVWPTAIAALLLLSVGLFIHYHNGTGQIAIADANDLEKNLIMTHDMCCMSPDHQHLKVPRTDDAAIVQAMHKELKQPVVMFHPADTSWVFRGASICSVGDAHSGHLVFAKGAGSLSVFSLPLTSLPKNQPATDFSAVVEQHNIVGFVKDGALFCLVSSGPTDKLSVDQLKEMESAMHPSVASRPRESSEPVLLTELLRPVGQN